MSYINFNGVLVNSNKPVLKANNRSFCYGDSLFESMKWQYAEILFLKDHLERLFAGMNLLKMKIPKVFSKQFFQDQVSLLLKKNNISGVARIRLQVYRNEGGFYTPSDNSISFVITAEKILLKNIFLQNKGLKIGLFSEMRKPKNKLSNYKTANSSIYTLAGIFARENKLDDCFILNTAENITDAVSSNVFILKNNILITPPLSDGCVDGVMRKNILKLCKKEKIKFIEKSISIKDILTAKEVFLSNLIQEIRWVKQFRKRKYANDFSKFLISKTIT